MQSNKKFRTPMLRYISLMKPGVLIGNVITGAAGFLFASATMRTFRPEVFIATIAGMTLIIAAACTLNNVLDQDIDRIMARTKRRAVASGDVKAAHALTFSIMLGICGAGVLALWAHWLVLLIGILGFVIYVWLYGAMAKRRSVHGTLVGSVSGAAPILAGYVAARGHIDAGAVLVFLTLFFWQFPEFYSIAIYRLAEYSSAKIPVITVVKSMAYTKRWIFAYTSLFVLASLMLTLFGYTGYIYAGSMAIIGAYWLIIAASGFRSNINSVETDAWARRMFHTSLNVILLYSVLISLGPLIP